MGMPQHEDPAWTAVEAFGQADCRRPVAPAEPAHDIHPPLRLELSLRAPGGGHLPLVTGDRVQQWLSASGVAAVEVELERTCPGCGGEAYVPITVSEVCRECTGDGRELVDGREQACSVCDGDGWMPRELIEQCERCDGTGLELTVAGRRLLRAHGLQLRAFLERWSGWTRVASAISPGGMG
jgi:hypothetical protein